MILSIGKVATYNHVAKAVNCKSCRAIGQALKKNPFAPEVPCHRIIRADGSLGGFSGSLENYSVIKKYILLKNENISFEKRNLIKNKTQYMCYRVNKTHHLT